MTEKAALKPLTVALRHCCPRCGEGKLYKGLLTVVPECAVCGLKTGEHDAGDGPVYCAMTLLCFGITGFAAYLELSYAPAFWLHGVVALLLTLSLTPLSLRFFTSYIIATQHRDGELRDGSA